MAITTRRSLKWALLTILLISTVFLLSFNATLRYIISERQSHLEHQRLLARNKAEERRQWDEAASDAVRGLLDDDDDDDDDDETKGGKEERRRRREQHERTRKEELEKYREEHLMMKRMNDENNAADDNVDDDKVVVVVDNDNSDLATPQLEEEVSKRRAHLRTEELELIQQSRLRAAREMKRERDNPTLGKFRVTARPLDGFAAPVRVVGDGDDDDGKGGGGYDDETDTIILMERPSLQSYSRQGRAHSTPGTNSHTTSQTNNNGNNNNGNNSNSTTATASGTPMLADAHYAKALRMLSSNFDRLKSKGGNALPHRVYEGDYDQQIEGRYGRGEEFVKFELKKRRNGRKSTGGGGRRKKKNKQGKRSTTSASYRSPNNEQHDDGGGDATKDGSSWEMNMEADEPILNILLEFAQEWYEDTKEWMYETFGIEMPYGDDVAGSNSVESSTSDGKGSSTTSSSSTFGMGSQYEEDEFSFRDTRVGSQLIWMYDKVAGLWSRQRRNSLSSLQQANSKKKTPQTDDDATDKKSNAGTDSSKSQQGSSITLSKADEVAREGLYHLEKAAHLGHSEAQRLVANSLASGILPLSDHGLMHRLAEYEYSHSPKNNWTSILLQKTLLVPDDFSTGGEQLAKAILLWHVSAMDGNVESAMALGYRHLYSATGGSTLVTDLTDDKIISTGYHPVHGGPIQIGNTGGSGSTNIVSGTTSMSNHYGVLGTCPTALAYYEAAAHGVMDELESGPTKGKVNPPIDEHRLAEIYTHGGASVSLESYNKPDELEEALQYYRMLASRNRSPEPDLVAAFTIANFYFNGYRGVKQDLRLALKYYEICGDYNHWEGGGQAGLMHVWGMGMTSDERDLGKAYAYFKQGTPGGVDGCTNRLTNKKREQQKKTSGEDVVLCDRHSINGMGLLSLLGVEGLVERDVKAARRWFEHGKEFGCLDATYNHAMLRLGWMVNELKDLPTKIPASESSEAASVTKKKTAQDQNYMTHRTAPADTSPKAFMTYNGPSANDYNVAIQDLTRAANKGHIQAKHRLATLYSSGATIPKKRGRPSKAVTQSCVNALRHFKGVADGGHTISRRNRAAWKQYVVGDYESSLRNYMSSAETGSEIGQVNAAFLLEQGHCLGMTRASCTRASVRLWRAAARQGNLEACLRVGDFYYYGRMKNGAADASRAGGLRAKKANEKDGSDDGYDGETAKVYNREEYLASLETKAFYFIPGPYRWTRYILYPEELFEVTTKWIASSAQILKQYLSAGTSSKSDDGDEVQTETSSQDDVCDEAKGTCNPEWAGELKYNDDTAAGAGTISFDDSTNEEDQNHMAIAAQYYRKAAEEHKSARANFNLGFMHEWGLGLTQDFPLAKRHYDLAGQEANMAVAIALWAMDIHQRAIKFGMMVKEYAMNYNWIAEVLNNNKLVVERDETTRIGRDDELAPLPAGETSSYRGDKRNPNSYSREDADGLSREQRDARTAAVTEDGKLIAQDDIINDMTALPEKSTPGFFPDYFENGFNNLPWKVHLWTLEDTEEVGPKPPFVTKKSAYMDSARIKDKSMRASLTLPINSHNGGRLCFAMWADIAMPWEDFRVSLISNVADIESSDHQFSLGSTKKYKDWTDVCFDIAPGNHEFVWSLAWPAYYDSHFDKESLTTLIDSTRGDPGRPSGKVLVDNLRFFPFVYDDFETGDFSLQKWTQIGDGAPWVISDGPDVYGHYAAYCAPTVDIPRGVSGLKLVVDMGYVGALLTFQVKVRTGEANGITDALWLLIDDKKIRPWFGDTGEWAHYTHYIGDGIHRLTWAFEMSGEDHEAAAWLDNIKFYTREGNFLLRPTIKYSKTQVVVSQT